MTNPAVILPIDPAKQKRYPVTVSEHLLGAPGKGRTRNAVVQYNHKPNFSAPPRAKSISRSPNSDKNYTLAIKGERDGEDYLYTGSQQPSEALALVYSPQTQTFILEKISGDFAFNLRSTPSNKSAKSLASQYPHLPVIGRDSEPESTNSNNSSDENDGVNDPSTGADSTNPYDYRHFLSKSRRSSSPEPLATTPNIPASPLRPIIPTASPTRRAPARPKQKPRPRPVPKRAPPSPPPREEADADNEDSDDGGLTIEMEPDIKTRRAFKPKFTHDPRNGPISLRSAASASASPAALSPANGQQSDEDEDMDILNLKEGEDIVDIAPTIPVGEDVGKEEEEEEEGEEGEEGEAAEEEEVEEQGEDDGGEGSLEAELEHALEQADGEDDGIGAWANTESGIDKLGYSGASHVHTLVDDSSSESEEE